MALKAPPGGRGTGCEDFFIFDWTPVFLNLIFGAGERKPDDSRPAFKRAGDRKTAPVGGRQPALESLAIVAGVGPALGLAQCRRSTQGHGRPHAVGEVRAARVD